MAVSAGPSVGNGHEPGFRFESLTKDRDSRRQSSMTCVTCTGCFCKEMEYACASSPRVPHAYTRAEQEREQGEIRNPANPFLPVGAKPSPVTGTP